MYKQGDHLRSVEEGGGNMLRFIRILSNSIIDFHLVRLFSRQFICLLRLTPSRDYLYDLCVLSFSVHFPELTLLCKT